MFGFRSISITKVYQVAQAVAAAVAKTVSLKLATSTSNKDVNTSFLDESIDYRGLITRNGDVTQGTDNPFGSDWSWFFNRSGNPISYISVSNQSLSLGTGDFTIEAWLNRTGLNAVDSTYGSTVLDFRTAEPSAQILIEKASSSTQLELWVNGSSRIISSTTLDTGTWVHFALVRQAGVTRLYINGVKEGVDYADTNNYSATSAVIAGRFAAVSGDFRPFIGYISNLRIVKGVALYTSAFTPSTSALSSTPETSLLICNRSILDDSSGVRNALTVTGNPITFRYSPFTSTEIQSIPTGSVYFDGTGDYLTVGGTTAFSLSGDFTVEAWIYPTAVPPTVYGGPIFSRSGGSNGWELRLQNTMQMSWVNPGVAANNFGPTLRLNTWYHIAVSKTAAGTLKGYVNGVEYSAGGSAGSASSNNIQVGSSGFGDFTGYISNARIVNGTALYTAAFTPSTSPLTAISGTSLLTCQGTSFSDASTNNFTITATGNARPTANSPFALTTTTVSEQTTSSRAYPTSRSVWFDGSSGLSLASNTAFGLGTGDFTIEAWIYPTVNPANGPGTIADFRTAPTASATSMRVNSSLQLQFYNGPANINNIFTSQIVTLNSWNHIACVRSSGTVYAYINGKLAGSATVSSNLGSDQPLLIGNNQVVGFNFNGCISNFRIVKGTAVYTAAFTPPTSPLTAISGTSLLTCQGTSFSDASTNNFAITRTGNVALNSNNPFAPTLVSQPVAPNRSVYFDGTGDYLSLPDGTAAVQFGSGDFTVEAWIYQTSSVNPGRIVNNWSSSTPSTASWEILVAPTSIIFACSSNGSSSQVSLSGTIGTGRWHHFAAVRSGNIFTLYVDGISVGSTTQSITLQAANTFTIAARRNSASYVEPFPGYISNLRIVKGTAVYTANFTPPTSDLTAISNTSLLTCIDGTFKDNSSNNFTLTQAGDARTTQFSPFSVSNSITFDGTGDFLTVPDNDTAFNFGSGNFTVEFWFNTRSISAQWILNQFESAAGTDTNSAFTFLFAAANKLQATVAYNNSTSQINLVSTTALKTGAWYHAALVRSGTSLTLYLNGVPEATSSVISTNVINNSNLNINIGQRQGGSNYYNGYLSNIRIVKGTAVYTAPFIPSTADLTAIGGTSLLLVGKQNFLDSSTNAFTVTRNGDAAITLDESGFVPGPNGEYYSTYFPGSASVTAASSAAAAFGTGDFTMGGWFYIASNVADYVQLFDSVFSGTTVGFRFGNVGFGYKLQFFTDSSSTATCYSTPLLQTDMLNTWTHIALTRAGGILRFFVNGKMQTFGSGANPSTYPTAEISSTTNITAGTFRVGVGLNGYAYGVGAIKGYALYTENFTPPTDAPTVIPGTSFLTCVSRAIEDVSPSNLALTTTGSPEVNVTVPTTKLNSWYFDSAASSHAIVNHSSALNILSGDFTVECWIQPEVAAGYKAIVGQWNQASVSTGGWLISLSANTPVFEFGPLSTGSPLLTSSTAVKIGQWNHIAVTRNGSSFTMYLNGVSVATATSATTGSYLAINTTVGNYYNSGGTIGATGAAYYKGHVSNIRILKGVVAYTGAFTPSSSPLQASQYSKNLSLLTARSSNVIDESRNNHYIRLFNSARVRPNTPFTKTSSSTTASNYSNMMSAGNAYFDGTGDSLAITGSTAFVPTSSEDFTIEFWWRPGPATITNSTAVMGCGWNGTNYPGWLFYVNSTGGLAFYSSSNGTSWDISNNTVITSTPRANVWHHVTACRVRGSIRLFLNGVLATTIVSSAALSTSATSVTLGAGVAVASPSSGRISSVRVIRGAGLYEGNFRPASAPLDITPATSLALDFRHAGLFDSTTKNNIAAFGDARVSNVQTRGGNTTVAFDGNGDYLTVPSSRFLDLYSGDFTVECWVRFNSLANTPHIFQFGTGTNYRWNVYVGLSTFRLYSTTVSGNGANRITGPSLSIDTWYHIAIVKSGSTITMYQDGVSVGTTTSNLFPVGNQEMGVGWNTYAGLAGDYFNGYLQGLKVTTEALYTSNFTPA